MAKIWPYLLPMILYMHEYNNLLTSIVRAIRENIKPKVNVFPYSLNSRGQYFFIMWHCTRSKIRSRKGQNTKSVTFSNIYFFQYFYCCFKSFNV